MNLERQKLVCERFYLKPDAIWADLVHKNLQWTLNGQRFGQGDLRKTDLLMILAVIEPDEVFEGWNEHHNSRWMQCENPIVRVTYARITQPERVPVSSETFAKIRERL